MSGAESSSPLRGQLPRDHREYLHAQTRSRIHTLSLLSASIAAPTFAADDDGPMTFQVLDKRPSDSAIPYYLEVVRLQGRNDAPCRSEGVRWTTPVTASARKRYKKFFGPLEIGTVATCKSVHALQDRDGQCLIYRLKGCELGRP